MKYDIKYEPNPKIEDIDILWKGISENAVQLGGHQPGRAYAYFLRDEHDQIKGGCSGYLFYGCLYVDLLWVDKLLRGNNYGVKLMEHAEQLASENNCHFITVNTMDFEALDFYKKLGYLVEFERHGFSKNSIMYFLRKDLSV